MKAGQEALLELALVSRQQVDPSSTEFELELQVPRSLGWHRHQRPSEVEILGVLEVGTLQMTLWAVTWVALAMNSQ